MQKRLRKTLRFQLVGWLLVLSLLGSCGSMEDKRDKFLDRGKNLFQKGDFIRARLEFKNALQIDPKYGPAYLWLGKTELNLQNPKNAFGNFNKAVEFDPNLLEGYILQGQLLLGARQLDVAAEKINAAKQRAPENLEVLLLEASLAAARENTPEALRLLAEVRRRAPEQPDAYLLQAALEQRLKKFDAASATLEAGLKSCPKTIALYVAQARLAAAQKQFEAAEKTLEQALALEPKNVRLYAELVQIYGLAAQPDKLEQTLRQIISLEPDQEAHAAFLAKFLAERKRGPEAEKVLTDFIQQHPQNYAARFSLADFYFSRRQETRGEKTLQEISSLDKDGPQGLQAKNRLAQLYARQGRLEAADKLIKEILQINPGDMQANLTQGLIALNQRDALKAVNSFRTVVKDQPQNAEYMLLLARAHLLNKEMEQAKDKAKQAVELKKDFLDARKFLYGLFVENKDFDGALQTIQGYLRQDDKDIFNLSALGEVYARQGNYAQAKATYQKIIDLDPGKPLGYFLMGLLAGQQKQPEAALKNFNLALAKQGDFIPALQQVLNIYQEQKQPDKALQAMQQAVGRHPQNAALKQMLGEFQLLQKQPQAAAAALEEALTLNPRQLAALQLLILAYQQQPNREALFQHLEERRRNPKNPPFYSLALAMLYERQPNAFDKAAAIYEEMIAQNRFADLARNNLAYGLAQHRGAPPDLEKAVQLITAALAEAPEDPNFNDTMGWVLLRQGDFTRAKPYLEQAVQKLPDNPSLLYHLGLCLAKLNDLPEARRNLEKAVAAKTGFPEQAEAQKLLESLGK